MHTIQYSPSESPFSHSLPLLLSFFSFSFSTKSGDGLYVAAGQANALSVWKRDDSKPSLTYAPLFTFTTPANTFFIETNAIAFAAGADILAAGWINVQVPAGQNRVTAFRLPSSKPILDHVGPVGQGQYQNIVTGVRVSESGKYVAMTSWGNQGQAGGTEQIQVRDLEKERERVRKGRLGGRILNGVHVKEFSCSVRYAPISFLSLPLPLSLSPFFSRCSPFPTPARQSILSSLPARCLLSLSLKPLAWVPLLWRRGSTCMQTFS